MVMAKERPECYSCSYKMYSDLFRSTLSAHTGESEFTIDGKVLSEILGVKNAYITGALFQHGMVKFWYKTPEILEPTQCEVVEEAELND